MSAERRRRGRGLFAVLLPTLECNLACTYCFEAHPRRRWSSEEARRVLEEVVALAAGEGFDELRLHWQGGEALAMGEAFWTEVLPLAEEVASRSGVELDQRLQTNLTLYGPWLAPLALRHLGGRLGTSYDGTGERRDARDGAEGFERRFWEAFAKASEAGLSVGVLAVVRPSALAEGAVAYLERLRSLGLRRLRLTLPFEAGSGRGGWLDAHAVGRFLADAYRRWAEGGRDDWFHIKPFAFLERCLAGSAPDEPGLCAFSENCAEGGLSVDPEGGAWLCDSCIGNGRRYGNALAGGLAAAWRGPERARVLRSCAELVGDRCLGCRWLPVCQGGCLVRSRPGPGGVRADHYCESYRALFDAVEVGLSRSAGAAPT
jgi:radical SAM protein with 4Fe4S-binding SPASM domain